VKVDTSNDLSSIMRMIKILRRNGRITKIAEIATELDVNDRTIRRYHHSIIKTGYDIISTRGPAGGYYLNESRIEDHEWTILKSALKNYPELYSKICFHVNEKD
jgi:predicted DNA-binding transcriptional regulator YafY